MKILTQTPLEFKNIITIFLTKLKKINFKNAIPSYSIIYDLKTKKIISSAKNNRSINNNIFGHSEFLALSKATKKLNNWHLNNMIILTSLEPCWMCFSAIIEARIKTIIFISNNLKTNTFKNFSKIDHKLLEKINIYQLNYSDYEKKLKYFFINVRKSKK